MKRIGKIVKEAKKRAVSFRLEWKPVGYTAAVLLAATGLSAIMYNLFIHNNNVSMIYALAVVVVACITPGYFYGVAAACVSVLGVNYFFTLPYWEFNFSLTGYPITFFTLLVASVITSTLVTGYRERDRVWHEAETEKLRSNLLRAISHDIRTPLTSISGASSTLIDSGGSLDSEQCMDLLSDIRENSQWLIRMVENLLSVTRMQGDSSIQKVEDVAEEVVAQAVAQVRKRFPRQRITVSAEEEPVLAPMDGTLISQVIINLIENAIFHSGTDMPIEVAARAKGNEAVFSVRDHGVGIDVNRICRLMDGHIDSVSTRDSTRGMGIGLSLCAAIVRSHGGEISAYNAPGGGAVFEFTLPME